MRIERVVSIASPLITLFKSGQSALLPALFRSVLVPDGAARRAAYRDLFGSALDDVPVSAGSCASRADRGALIVTPATRPRQHSGHAVTR